MGGKENTGDRPGSSWAQKKRAGIKISHLYWDLPHGWMKRINEVGGEKKRGGGFVDATVR